MEIGILEIKKKESTEDLILEKNFFWNAWCFMRGVKEVCKLGNKVGKL